MSIHKQQIEPAFPEPIMKDRKAFLDDLKARPGWDPGFITAIDELIGWSERQNKAIIFTPRRGDRKQFFVTYSLMGPEHTFWQAYPHKDDAHFHITAAKVAPA